MDYSCAIRDSINFCFFGNIRNPLKTGLVIVTIIASLLAGLIAAFDLSVMMSADYKTETLGASTIGIGPYVIIFCGIIIPIIMLLLKGKRVKVLQEQDQHQPSVGNE